MTAACSARERGRSPRRARVRRGRVRGRCGAGGGSGSAGCRDSTGCRGGAWPGWAESGWALRLEAVRQARASAGGAGAALGARGSLQSRGGGIYPTGMLRGSSLQGSWDWGFFGVGACCQVPSGAPIRLQVCGGSQGSAGREQKVLCYLGEDGDSEPLGGPGVVPISVVSATSPTFPLQ